MKNNKTEPDKIKVIIDNWLGKVSFELTQEEIDEFVEDYEWEYDENNHTIHSLGNFFSEPYESLDPSGKFVVVSEYSIYDGGFGYLFEFINCDCPVGLEEYIFKTSNHIHNDIYEESWVFIDDNKELIKDNNNKSKFSDTENHEIRNCGSGCLRISDFNYKEFFDFIGAKEQA